MNREKAKVLAFMKENQMADGGDGVLAAVSGGADSVCLLFMLHELAGELGIRLSALHVNHGLRGAEADRDEAFVETLCRELSVPLAVVHADVAGYGEKNGFSTEEAGRILRYRFLEERAGELGFSRIAVAHHQDDAAETVLLNLFRGSGLRGLSGIRPVRGKIIRPLLCLTRDEIEAYLTGRGRSWCEDSTNRENAYMRNKIRNELLPWVEEHINARTAGHLLSFASQAFQADRYLEEQAARLLEESGGGPEADGILVKVLDAQPEILKAYLVRAMIFRAAGRAEDISERHVRAVLSLTGPGGGTSVDLPYGLRAVRGYERLEIVEAGDRESRGARAEAGDGKWNRTGESRGAQAEAGDGERVRAGESEGARAEAGDRAWGVCPGIPGCQPVFRVFPRKKGEEIPKNQYTKWFDYDKIKGTLSVRTRKEGDYFLLKGGGRKTVRRYMIDEKIPEADRDRMPLLAEGTHVLWVIGCRISEYYKVTEATETILEVHICKGENHG